MALGARHARRWLVEQQHLGLQAERDRDLDQALAAIRELGDAVARIVLELQGLEHVHRLVDHIHARARRPDHGGGRADPLGDGDVDVLEDRESAEQPVDLEGACDPKLDPFGLGDRRDVVALQQHLTTRGLKRAGEKVDEGGLARAVGTDQRMTRTRLEPEVDLPRGGERAEVSAKAAGLEQALGHGDARVTPKRRSSDSLIPRMPLRPHSAMTTSKSPSPSCQAVGESWARRCESPM